MQQYFYILRILNSGGGGHLPVFPKINCYEKFLKNTNDGKSDVFGVVRFVSSQFFKRPDEFKVSDDSADT